MNHPHPLPNPAEIRWQCRRGMLELDILLLSFLEKSYETLLEEEQRVFVELLSFQDQELFEWLMDRSQPDSPVLQAMIKKIREGKWEE